jgi:UDP:flavonoid glycosyltransferase YjiC (YdhE family)
MIRPRRFLITSWDGGGNTPAAINLGARLVRAGHAVRLLGWEAMGARAESAGLEFRAYPSMQTWPEGLSLDDGWDRMADLLHGPATRDDILRDAREFAPDVLVLDCMMLSAFDAARELGRPTAVLMHVLYAPFVFEWGDAVMKTHLVDLMATSDRVLALTPVGFDQDCELPANTSYVGPINRPLPARTADELGDLALATPGDPWILLSLSTTLQGQLEALPPMLDAIGSLPVRALLTLGPAVPSERVSAPDNVVVRSSAPHDLVLPHMAAVLAHGGLSTIMSALSCGVPLVCVPQGREQPLNAERVEATGVGRALGRHASPAEIAKTLDEVIRDPSFRTAATGFAASIATLGDGAAATKLVEDLAG